MTAYVRTKPLIQSHPKGGHLLLSIVQNSGQSMQLQNFIWTTMPVRHQDAPIAEIAEFSVGESRGRKPTH